MPFLKQLQFSLHGSHFLLILPLASKILIFVVFRLFPRLFIAQSQSIFQFRTYFISHGIEVIPIAALFCSHPNFAQLLHMLHFLCL